MLLIGLPMRVIFLPYAYLVVVFCLFVFSFRVKYIF